MQTQTKNFYSVDLVKYINGGERLEAASLSTKSIIIGTELSAQTRKATAEFTDELLESRYIVLVEPSLTTTRIPPVISEVKDYQLKLIFA